MSGRTAFHALFPRFPLPFPPAGLAAAGLLAAALMLTACTQTIEGRAQPRAETGTVDAIDATSTKSSDPTKPSGRRTTTGARPTTKNDRRGFDAAVGECVALAGSVTEATIEKASCGSREANYKVIGKAGRSSECVGDADNFYAESRNGVEQGALCLDIDWVTGGCIDVGDSRTPPRRIDCTARDPIQGVRVISVQQNAAGPEACGSAGSGFVYPERRFVVCVEEL